MVKYKTKLTPVRYPGGKSNALKTLDPYFLKSFSEYREPFFGGGSVGLYLMQFNKDADYWVNDLFYPVYCFWKMLYERPDEMVETLLKIRRSYSSKHDNTKKKKTDTSPAEPSDCAKAAVELHKQCRERIEERIAIKDEFKVACMWYILNKTSYSGMAMIGSYAPLAWDQNFTETCISNLPETNRLLHSVKSFKITCEDYSSLLTSSDRSVFIFLDPPYKISHNLYGKNGDLHEQFNHQLFADTIKKCDSKWMITYNQDLQIEEWFNDPKYKQWKWDLTYTMKSAKRNVEDKAETKMKYADGEEPEKSGKKGKELLIWNYDHTA